MKRVLIVYRQGAFPKSQIHLLMDKLREHWQIDAMVISSGGPFAKDFCIYDIDHLDKGEIEAIQLEINKAKPARWWPW